MLIHVDDDSPGWTRVRHSRGFSYRDKIGRCIKDRKIRRRLQSLGIPPAWTEVWICPQDNGYLQVTGHNEKGRKLENAVVKRVAKHIGNTMAVCRQYYIHPAILDAVAAEQLPQADTVTEQELARFEPELAVAECLAYRLITNE